MAARYQYRSRHQGQWEKEVREVGYSIEVWVYWQFGAGRRGGS